MIYFSSLKQYQLTSTFFITFFITDLLSLADWLNAQMELPLWDTPRSHVQDAPEGLPPPAPFPHELVWEHPLETSSKRASNQSFKSTSNHVKICQDMSRLQKDAISAATNCAAVKPKMVMSCNRQDTHSCRRIINIIIAVLKRGYQVAVHKQVTTCEESECVEAWSTSRCSDQHASSHLFHQSNLTLPFCHRDNVGKSAL